MDYIYQQFLSIFLLLFSVVIHEYAHGYAALTQGDDTARLSGRLTLNPLAHLDPVGSLLVPLLLILSRSRVLIGWAKPVPINPLRFRDMDYGTVLVSFAGPFTNLILGTVFALAYRMFPHVQPVSSVFLLGSLINFWLAFFNLVPIPPLDGSRILSVFLPFQWKWSFLRLERYGMIIILLLLYSGLLGWISSLANFLVSWLANVR